MKQIMDSDIRKQTSVFIDALSKGNKASLAYDDFIRDTMNLLYKDTAFPEEVKIPKSVTDLLRGDFEPAEIIRMAPPEIDGIPIWRGSTLNDKGVVLRGAGYVNGDSRKPCHIALDDNIPHGLLAGATGHGKSVTLNSAVITACLEYAPWEVQFALVDAKIVEMKAYAMNGIIPHIASVAATSDAEFIISVLEDAVDVMMARNSIFTIAGVKNIQSFVKSTGLAMPHIMIVMDEFQTMFMNAQKKSKFINELIAKVARLGRNTGVHLLLASQELGSELDKSVLGNIGTRLCLGCMPKTSEQILGNDEAKINFGLKGRLIINNNPAADNNQTLNVPLRTPFLPDINIGAGIKTIFDYMKLLECIGAQAKDTKFHNLSFYDEDLRWYTDMFKEYLIGKSTPKLLYLGEPSFVLKNDDGERWLRLEFKNDLGQNLLILTATAKNRTRFVSMIMYNLKAARENGYKFNVDIYYTNKESFANVDIGLCDYSEYKREYTDVFEKNLNLMLWRRTLTECDELAFGDLKSSAKDLALYEEVIAVDRSYSGELWKNRALALISLLNQNYYKTAFEINPSADRAIFVESIASVVFCAFNLFKAKNAETSKLTMSSFDDVFVFLLDIDLLSGIGVDGKSRQIEALKKIIKESPEYKVFFIISSGTLEECAVLRSAITHVILDASTPQHQSQLKIVDHFPDTVSAALGVYYLATAETNKCRKFKKMIYDGEIL